MLRIFRGGDQGCLERTKTWREITSSFPTKFSNVSAAEEFTTQKAEGRTRPQIARGSDRRGASALVISPAKTVCRKTLSAPAASGACSALRPLRPLRWTPSPPFAKTRPPADRLRSHQSGRIAQAVEQLTLNQRVPGSSPGAPTLKPRRFLRFGGIPVPVSSTSTTCIRPSLRARNAMRCCVRGEPTAKIALRAFV